jgi:hypothetical protein
MRWTPQAGALVSVVSATGSVSCEPCQGSNKQHNPKRSSRFFQFLTAGIVVCASAGFAYARDGVLGGEVVTETFAMKRAKEVFILDKSKQPHPDFPVSDILDFGIWQVIAVTAFDNSGVALLSQYCISDNSGRICKCREPRQNVSDKEFNPDGFDYGRGCPIVNEVDMGFWSICALGGLDVEHTPLRSKGRFGITGENVSALTGNGSIYQSFGRSPQQECCGKQQQREQNQETIGDLYSVSEYRPKLASLVSSIIGIIGAFILCVRGAGWWDDGYRAYGAAITIAGYALVISSIAGLLVGLDPWSLWERFV